MSAPAAGGGTPGQRPGEEVLRRWYAARDQAEAQRDALLASDAEREQVCALLNRAFSEGRLTSPELDERTSRALAARTRGELEDVLAGLEGMESRTTWNAAPQRGLLPRLVFWVVGLLTAPFILMGAGLLLAGSDGGDRVFGIVVLTLFLPGLIALHRWAHPRR